MEEHGPIEVTIRDGAWSVVDYSGRMLARRGLTMAKAIRLGAEWCLTSPSEQECVVYDEGGAPILRMRSGENGFEFIPD